MNSHLESSFREICPYQRLATKWDGSHCLIYPTLPNQRDFQISTCDNIVEVRWNQL